MLAATTTPAPTGYAALNAIQPDPVASQDPAYLAFIRGAGYSEAEALADVARRQSQLQRQMDRAEPRFADETRIGQAQIADQYAGNGLYRGGARMQSQVDQRNDVARQRLEFRSGIQDEQANAQADAYRNIADLRRQAAERALQGRTDVATARANAGLR